MIPFNQQLYIFLGSAATLAIVLLAYQNDDMMMNRLLVSLAFVVCLGLMKSLSQQKT
jgi:hypothetical protein